MSTLVASGTQTAVIGTEHTLSTDTSNGNFVFKVDANAMASGDTLELRIYDVVLASGVSRVAYFSKFTDAQGADDKIKVSVPVPANIEFKATLKQTAGTGRAFPWSVLKL